MTVFACPMCMMIATKAAAASIVVLIGAVLPKIIGTKKISPRGSGLNFKPPSFNKSLRPTFVNRVKVFTPPSKQKTHN